MNDLSHLSERADPDVMPVRITKRQLSDTRVGIHIGLLFESGDERAGPACPCGQTMPVQARDR